MQLNFEPALSCSRTHWKVFEKKIQATSKEKVGMYREKSAPEELIVSGICCLRLRLLRRFSRSDQLLSIFRLGAPAYFFESNLASSWAPPVVSRLVTLKFRSWSSPVLRSKSICFSCDRTLREALFLSTLAHHFVSISSSVKTKEDNRDIFRGGTSKENSKIRGPCNGHPIEINFFLKKEERDGTGFNFPAFKRDGSGFDFPFRPWMAISLLVAGQSAASIPWKPSRDMGEQVLLNTMRSAHNNKLNNRRCKQKRVEIYIKKHIIKQLQKY